jgi:Ca2+/H+ antiporter, TMEM165/GDT1 family
MDAFLVSAGVIALGEIGDKTQLLALLLGARFRRPLPVILGILTATLANHALAGLLGVWVRSALDPQVLRWGLGVSFLGVAIWALFPDKLDATEQPDKGRWNIFSITLWMFFLAEIGDKTQVATVMLAAKFSALLPVVAGTTIGMLIADVPALMLGKLAAFKIPLKWMRIAAAIVFAALGVFVLAAPASLL